MSDGKGEADVIGPIPPKAVRDGYDPSPFVFEQRYRPDETRLVAWTRNIDQLKSLFYALLNSLPATVEVLFKTETDGESGRDGWQRYSGTTHRDIVIKVVKENEELVFHDGGSLLCVKRPDTSEYFVLDEHGTIFIYSADPSHIDRCQALGFERRASELLDQLGHWHVRAERHEEQESTLVKELGLASVA